MGAPHPCRVSASEFFGVNCSRTLTTRTSRTCRLKHNKNWTKMAWRLRGGQGQQRSGGLGARGGWPQRLRSHFTSGKSGPAPITTHRCCGCSPLLHQVPAHRDAPRLRGSEHARPRFRPRWVPPRAGPAKPTHKPLRCNACNSTRMRLVRKGPGRPPKGAPTGVVLNRTAPAPRSPPRRSRWVSARWSTRSRPCTPTSSSHTAAAQMSVAMSVCAPAHAHARRDSAEKGEGCRACRCARTRWKRQRA